MVDTQGRVCSRGKSAGGRPTGIFEETGSEISGEFIELTPLKQPSGKVVYAWAVEGNIDAGSIKSNLFQWNGRRNREKSGSFQKWIGEVGLRFPRRKKS